MPTLTSYLDAPKASTPRTAARVLLGTGLAGFGIAHLTIARKAFRAQVPQTMKKNLPASTDEVVVVSGVVEIGLGAMLLALPRERRTMGMLLAAYFAAIFPGNIAQLLNHEDAFGLDTDRKRIVRLLFQPVFVAWSLFAGEVI